jgi:hypothetical protein
MKGLSPNHNNVFVNSVEKYSAIIKGLHQVLETWPLWQYGVWSFQTGGTKFESFLPKNQHTQRKLLNFENWVNEEVSKVPKLDFQSQFSMSKIIRIFLNFFFID